MEVTIDNKNLDLTEQVQFGLAMYRIFPIRASYLFRDSHYDNTVEYGGVFGAGFSILARYGYSATA